MTLCAVHVLGAAALAGPQAQTYRTIALSGDPVPGYPEGTTWYQGSPRFNNAGQVLCMGYFDNVDGDDDLVLVRIEPDGQLTVLLTAGDKVPGLPEATSFRDFSFLIYGDFLQFNDGGDVAFPGSFQDVDGKYAGSAVFSSAGGQGMRTVAIEGQQAPGFVDGVTIDELWMVDSFGYNFNTMKLSDAGHVAFNAYLDGPGLPTLRHGTPCVLGWSDTGALSTIASQGSQVPGLPAGVTYNYIASSLVGEPITTLPQVNALGQTAFVSGLSGTGVTFDNNFAIFVDGRTVGPVVRAGDQAGGLAPGIKYKYLRPRLALNDLGQLAFVATLTGADIPQSSTALFCEMDELGPRALVRSGDQAPGLPPGVSLYPDAYDSDIELNNAGQVAFTAGINGPDVSATAILVSGAHRPTQVVAMEGDPMPGIPDATIGYLDGLELRLADSKQLNGRGQLAFVTIWNDSAGLERLAILAADTDGQLHLIASEGSVIDVDNDPVQTDLREIEAIGFPGYALEWSSFALNDNGEIAFFVIFTDDTSGIFSTSIPETAACRSDLDGDNTVGLPDLQLLLDCFGSPEGDDLNGDGSCDLDDLQLMLFNFGQACT